MTQQGFHENLRRQEEVTGSSNRGFGLVFAFVFSVVGLLPVIGGGSPRSWALTVSAIFLVIALLAPGLLKPLNQVWLRVGLLLHKIVNPVAMGLIFFLAMVPVALIIKVIRRDALRLRMDRSATSYWIARTSPGTDPAAMRNQF